MVAQRDTLCTVDLDGHWEDFDAEDLEVLPAPTPASQRFFEWLFTKGLKWMMSAIGLALAYAAWRETWS